MLPKALLEVVKRRPTIRPRYREPTEYLSVAATVIDLYERAAEGGWTRRHLEAELAAIETHDTFKLVRGLATLLDRRATFEHVAPVDPRIVREAVFAQGFVTTEREREEVIAATAADFDLTADELAGAFWADREDEAVLVAVPATDPDSLLRQYNLSLTQTLLFDAHELTFTVSENYQEVFGLIKRLGLMYLVDEDLAVTVTGPGALFTQTRTYGTTLAKLLPSITKADAWYLSASVETEVSNETRMYEFELDASQAHFFPDPATAESDSFDSELERDFATRIDALADGWTIVREPTILRTGTRVMIPDFSFVRDRGPDEPAFYLEVIGFWTPAYLDEKIEKIRQVEADHPLMLAVDRTLNCTESTFASEGVDAIFFFEDQIPIKPVLARLNAIDERHVAADVAVLTIADLDLPTNEVRHVDVLAQSCGVEPDAVRRILDAGDSGVISNDRYVPPAILETIDDRIAAMDDPTVADVTPVLEQLGLAVTVLDAIGYTVEFTSLDQSEATVRPAT